MRILKKKEATGPASATASQEFLPVKEIRDGIVVLTDGRLCAVLIASSLNFSLKSTDEQRSTLAQFQNFLNSLDFSVQILIQSRRADIRPYLAQLQEKLLGQTNELLKIQTQEYIRFIKTFTEQIDIMKKSFYVVVPFEPTIADQSDVKSLLKGNQNNSILTAERFEEYRSQLEQRLSIVEGGLAGAGVRTLPLGTEELIELFYHTFNPADLNSNAPGVK